MTDGVPTGMGDEGPSWSLHRLAAFADLAVGELAALRGLGGPPTRYVRDQVIRRQGDECSHVFLLQSGWVASSADLPDGKRQISKIHLPGDIMGAPSLPLTKASETLTALNDCLVRRVAAAELAELFDKPRLAMIFFLAAQEERVFLIDRLLTVGRLLGRSRMAAFLLHLYDRLKVNDPDHPPVFELPLTQEQIGDVLGLTPVHVNRVLRALEEDGLIARENGRVELLDMDQLRRTTGLSKRTVARNQPWLPRTID